jgi:DNA modification methylase
MRIEVWPIDQVIPYARNARTITAAAIDKVAGSIREFGWRQPIVVDAHRVIIVGHTRLLAARKLDMTEVPVHVADLTPAQVKAYRLMDNRSHDETSWDYALLGPELLDLQALGLGNLELTGFDQNEIADFLAGAASPGQEGLTPDDEAPALPSAPVTQPGELWLLGQHRLLCGDATVPADLHRVLAGDRADLVIVDPPYNVDYEGATKDKLRIAGDKMTDAAFFEFLLAAYRNLAAVTRNGAGIYVFHADTEGVNFRRALVDAGWKLAQCCVWVKQTIVMGRQDYHWQHEPILYGWKPGASHRWFTDRKQSTVWNFDKPSRSTDHPTMKPVDLISYPILNSSRAGEIVLDTFGGSGSTLIACAKHGRQARLLEIDPKYCDVIIRRWEAWSGEKALNEENRSFEEVSSERLAGKALPALQSSLGD